MKSNEEVYTSKTLINKNDREEISKIKNRLFTKTKFIDIWPV